MIFFIQTQGSLFHFISGFLFSGFIFLVYSVFIFSFLFSVLLLFYLQFFSFRFIIYLSALFLLFFIFAFSGLMQFFP